MTVHSLLAPLVPALRQLARDVAGVYWQLLRVMVPTSYNFV